MINESSALASGIFCIFVLTMKKYVDVILPLPLPRCFTYSLPDEGAEEVQIGCRVVVPFGRKKYYTAIVRNVHHYAPTEYEVKEISTVLDTSPILLPGQFRFWEWLADYYLCTQGDVYKAALPSGLKLESETIVEYNPDFEADAPLSEREQLVLDLLAKEPEQCVTKLEKESGLKNILTVIKSLLDKEALFVKEELRRTYKPKTEARVRLAADASGEENLRRIFDELERAPKQLALLMKYVELSGVLGDGASKEVSKKELLQRASASPAIFNGLVEKQIFEVYYQEIGRLNRLVGKTVELNVLNHAELSGEECLSAPRSDFQWKDRSIHPPDRRDVEARQAGALSVARNSIDYPDHRTAETGVRLPVGNLSLQVPRRRESRDLAKAVDGGGLRYYSGGTLFGVPPVSESRTGHCGRGTRKYV